MPEKCAIICPVCSRQNAKPLFVIPDINCAGCIKELLPRLKIFLSAQSAFQAKRGHCNFTEACRYLKEIYAHKEKNKDHEIFIVDFF